MVEELLNISGPAAFTFVSVLVAMLGFAYKIWSDLQQTKEEPTDCDENKISELDNRIYILEKQMKDIPKKLEELSESMIRDDEKIHQQLNTQVGEIKEMIKDNKQCNADNYAKLENRIYDLMKGNYKRNINNGNKD